VLSVDYTFKKCKDKRYHLTERADSGTNSALSSYHEEE
jgi:hypothetical protein